MSVSKDFNNNKKNSIKEINTLFYEQAVRHYGISAKGVHWHSQFSQYKRFKVLTDFIEHDIHNSNIVDVGCGMGEYYTYLTKHQQLPRNYRGIDCEFVMIDICHERYPTIPFVQKNILKDQLEQSDYYICSGAMNLLEQQDMVLFIQKCYTHSIKGFAFNALNNNPYTGVHIENILTVCKNITTHIKTTTHYLPNDVSVFMYKT